MAEEILVLENITKVYPNGFVANKDVNLSVRKGEIHALVGENGAGKTTLMKILFGIYKQDFGNVLIWVTICVVKHPTDSKRFDVFCQCTFCHLFIPPAF